MATVLDTFRAIAGHEGGEALEAATGSEVTSVPLRRHVDGYGARSPWHMPGLGWLGMMEFHDIPSGVVSVQHTPNADFLIHQIRKRSVHSSKDGTSEGRDDSGPRSGSKL